jgi:hypothetical protein
MHENSNSVWKCKCNCISKQSHKSKWAFVSKYKNFSKYKKSSENELTNSNLVNKLLLKKTNRDKTIQLIPVKKVKYDNLLGKIIIESNDEVDTQSNKKISKINNQDKSHKTIIQDDLIEIKKLFNIAN